MNNCVKQYEDTVSRYRQILFEELNLKIGVFQKMFEEIDSENYNVEITSPILPLITESLQVDCVISVSKLIEGNRGDKTIQKFLNFTDSNITFLKKSFPSITKELIRNHRNDLELINNEIMNTLTQRDKYFAHSDKLYFLNKAKIHSDYPRTHYELIKIIQHLQKIISDHDHVITGSRPMDMSGFAYAYTDKVVRHIKKGEREWLSNTEDNELP